MRDPLDNAQVADTVRGFIRQHAARDFMLRDVVRIIVDFYHSRFDSDVFVDVGREYFVVPRKNLSLSKLLSSRVEVSLKQPKHSCRSRRRPRSAATNG